MRANQPYDARPEPEELSEEGFLLTAQNMLMCGEGSKSAQWIQNEKAKDREPLETTELSFDVEEAMNSGIFVSGTSGCGKNTLAFWLTRKLIEHGVIVFVIDPSQTWKNNRDIESVLTIPQSDKPIRVDWRAESTIFDISMLYVRNQRKFVNAFCGEVFNKATHGFKPNVFVWLEDAELYVPNNSLRSNDTQELLRLIGCGRNYNIRYGLITKFSAMVDKLVIKLCKQRFFGWSNEKNDLTYLKGFLGDRSSELGDLQVGEFLYSYSGKIAKVKTERFDKAQLRGYQYLYTTPTQIINQ